MTYYPDGTYVSTTGEVGHANKKIRYCGWLSAGKSFKIGPPAYKLETLSSIVQNHTLRLMMGVHTCELCGKEEGNGEIWLQADGYWVMPNMIFHYVKEHNYQLPECVEDALLKNTYSVLKNEEQILNIPYDEIAVPYLKYVAYWRESRYENFKKFFGNNVSIPAKLNDGMYVVDMPYLNEAVRMVSKVDLLDKVHLDPLNFPDKIEIITIFP